jgi:dihydroorotase-like cyclic amidohydrolase
MTGWPVATWLRGEMIMKDNKILAKPGYGRWIASEVAP